MTAHAIRRLSAVLGLLLLLAGPTGAGLSGRAEAAKSGNQKRALQKKKVAKTRAKAVARRNARKAKQAKGKARASGSLPRPKKSPAASAGALTVAAVTVDANRPKPETLAASGSANAPAQPAAETTAAGPATDTTAPATGSTATATRSAATATRSTAKATRSTAKAPRSAATAPRTSSKKTAGKKSAAMRALPMAAAEITSAQRETKAKNLVASRIKSKGGPAWEVSTPALQFVGDKTNPVTGSGPIEVIARQKVKPRGFWARLKHALSPSAERKFLVLVDPQGAATIISSEAHGPLFRAVKTLTDKLPLREYIADAVKSKGAKNGAGMAVGGAGVIAATSASGVGLVVGIGLIVRGIQTYQEGIQRRTVARTKAMEKTVADIKTAVNGGQTVTLSEAYRIYTRDLANLEQDGAVTGGTITPASLKDFTSELTTYGL